MRSTFEDGVLWPGGDAVPASEKSKQAVQSTLKEGGAEMLATTCDAPTCCAWPAVRSANPML
jgi:hypothetical protein